MQEKRQNIAVLFFSRSGRAEADAKSFIPDSQPQRDSQLAESFIAHTKNQITQSQLPYIVFDEKRQQGTTFGERFTNAFLSVFEQGYDYVIAVGNDTPELKASHINRAADQLRSGEADIVLGPAKDGGTWLTAYSKKAFNARQFQQYPWQKSELLTSILDGAGEKTDILILEELADIDDYPTLVQFVENNRHKFQNLVRFIRSVLASLIPTRQTKMQSLNSQFYYRTYLLRAPPMR